MSNFNVKVTRSKVKETNQRHCHKQCTYEIWTPYLKKWERYCHKCIFIREGQTTRSKVTFSKVKLSNERSCQKQLICDILTSYLKRLKRYCHKCIFLKVGQTSRSRSLGQKSRYQMKGVVTSNAHLKYLGSICCGSKVIVKVKVFG